MDSFPELVPNSPEPEPEETKEEEEPEEVKIFVNEPAEIVPVDKLQNEEPYQMREVPPPKKKRQISEKQKIHLAKARVASAAKKRAKTAEKQALEQQVRQEMARRAPTPVQQPTYAPQEDEFELFLNNMSKFKEYEHKFNVKQAETQAKAKATKTKVQEILTPLPKPVPPKIISTPIKNVYSDAFSW